MSRKLGHPAPATLARLHAGLPGGRHGRRLSAHIAHCPDCARVCAQLDAISATLGETLRPPLPAVIERRILMAMTAETVRRQAGHAARGRHARRPPSASFPRLVPLVDTTAI